MDPSDTLIKTVWVTSSFVGFHRYPDAPDHVAYLASAHRHVFNVKVTVRVAHSNRSVEFHSMKQQLDYVLLRNPTFVKLREPKGSDVSTLSCEMMAEELIAALTTLGYDVMMVQVDEDGECGAQVMRVRNKETSK